MHFHGQLFDTAMRPGLPEPLFQHLTSSPAEPHLLGLKDLFLNIHGSYDISSDHEKCSFKTRDTAIEAQAFSLQEPSYFFSTYSPPRTESGYKPARARLEEDLRFVSRMVRSLLSSRLTTLSYPKDRQCLHHTERIPLYPILYALSSSSIRPS
jgi:syntaxin-binding protein 1